MNDVISEDLVSLDTRDLMQADLYELVQNSHRNENEETERRLLSPTSLSSRRHSEDSSALLAALSETRSVISQITLINGEKIWMTDDISELNNNNNTHHTHHNNNNDNIYRHNHNSSSSSFNNNNNTHIHGHSGCDHDDSSGVSSNRDSDEFGYSGKLHFISGDEPYMEDIIDLDGFFSERHDEEPPLETKDSLLRSALTGKTSFLLNNNNSSSSSISQFTHTSHHTSNLNNEAFEDPFSSTLSVTLENDSSSPPSSPSNSLPVSSSLLTSPDKTEAPSVENILLLTCLNSSRRSDSEHSSVSSLLLLHEDEEVSRRRSYVRRPKEESRKETRLLHHCHICSKGFKDRYSVNVHVRTHTGEKPFACSLCGKCFRQKAHLAKHHQTHASKNPLSAQILSACSSALLVNSEDSNSPSPETSNSC